MYISVAQMVAGACVCAIGIVCPLRQPGLVHTSTQGIAWAQQVIEYIACHCAGAIDLRLKVTSYTFTEAGAAAALAAALPPRNLSAVAAEDAATELEVMGFTGAQRVNVPDIEEDQHSPCVPISRGKCERRPQARMSCMHVQYMSVPCL